MEIVRIVRFGLLLCALPLTAIAQPSIDIISPLPDVCFGNGADVFPGFPGGEARPDPRDIPLVLELGSVSGGPITVVADVDGVEVLQEVFIPAAPNTPEQTDAFSVPGFLVLDDPDFTLTITATADDQDADDAVSFRLDREPPQMVVDVEDLDRLAGCHAMEPNLPFAVEDAQDDNPQQASASVSEGCLVTRTYTLTDDCGNAQAVAVEYQQAPAPNQISVELIGYRCGLVDCDLIDDPQSFDDGDRIGRGTVVYEIEEPLGCIDVIDAEITLDDAPAEVLVPGTPYEEAGPYVATVTVSACGVEQASDTLRFEVLARPEADIGGPYVVQQGQPLVLDASGSQIAPELGGLEGATWAWDVNNDGFYDDEEGLEATTDAFDSSVGDGQHRVWVRLTAANGGIDYDDTFVTVTDVTPECDLAEVEGGPFAEGVGITFNATGSVAGHADEPIEFYDWDFGDDRVPQRAADLAEPTHIFENSGDFEVRVQVHDRDSFCTATVNVVVEDCDPIVEGLAAFNPDNLLEGEQVRFTAGLTRPCNPFDGIDSYRWTFEEGGQAVEEPGLREPRHVYDDDGEKEVCLQVFDEDGQAEACFDIVILDLQPLPAFAGPNIAAEGDEACFDATNTIPGGPADPLDRLEWDFGDDSDPVVVEDVDGDRVVCHVFQGSGEFTVTLTAHDEDSSASAERVVTVTDVAPTARGRALLDEGQLSVDEGDLVTLDAGDSEAGADSDPIVEYRWEFGDGESETTERTSVQHAFGDDGTYAVRLTVVDSDGSEQSDTFAVQVRNVAPEIELRLDNGEIGIGPNGQERIEIEIGTEAQFSVLVDDVEADLPPGRVVWDFNDGSLEGDNVNDAPRTTNDHVYNELGQFTVSVEVDDYDGDCVAIAPVSPDECGRANEPERCACAGHDGDGDACLRTIDNRGTPEPEDDRPLCRIVGSNDTAELTFVVSPAAPRIRPVIVDSVCEGEPVDFLVDVQSAVRGQEAGMDIYDGPVVIGFPRKPDGMECAVQEGGNRERAQTLRCQWLPTFFDSGAHQVRVTAVGPFTDVSRSIDIDVTVRECGQPLLAGVGGTASRGLLRLFSYGRRAGNVDFSPTAEVVIPLGATSLAVGPDGRHVFVSSPGSGGVAVVNSIGRSRVLRVIPTGNNPSAVVRGDLGGVPWIWAVNSGDDTVSVIDPHTLKVEHTVPLGPVQGAYDLAWLGEVYTGEGCDGPGEGCELESEARLVVSSRRGSQVALLDPVAAAGGESSVLAVHRFPGPIVRVAAEGASGVIGAIDGKSRAFYAFAAEDLEDVDDADGFAMSFVPRDLFVRDGIVTAVSEGALATRRPGQPPQAACNDVRGIAIAPLPEAMLPEGDFVAWMEGRVENFVRDGQDCGAARAIGDTSPTLRRLTTFVGME